MLGISTVQTVGHKKVPTPSLEQSPTLLQLVAASVKNSATIGQVTRLLRSLELRAVSHRTVLLLRDQKLLLRIRDCFEGSTQTHANPVT